MAQIFPIDFDEKLTIANGDFILFSDSEDGNKIKKAQYSNLKGEQGDPGTPGADGAAATVTVGSVSTLPAGSSATVTNSGTSSAAVLNFGIPEGATGTPGADGQDGQDGAAATITVGTTTTLSPGSSATVTNVGTSSAAIFNFGIPKGESGTGSGDVSGPVSSVDGDVAVFDGTTGKLIKDGSVALSTLSSAATLASSAIQPGDDISDLNNDVGYTTNTGDVVGPASSTNGHLALFDGATGKLLKDGGAMPTIPAVSSISVTLDHTAWSLKRQTVAATGVTASNIVITAPAPSDIADWSENGVFCSTQASGQLTFECDTEPNNDIDVNVVILS